MFGSEFVSMKQATKFIRGLCFKFVNDGDSCWCDSQSVLANTTVPASTLKKVSSLIILCMRAVPTMNGVQPMLYKWECVWLTIYQASTFGGEAMEVCSDVIALSLDEYRERITMILVIEPLPAPMLWAITSWFFPMGLCFMVDFPNLIQMWFMRFMFTDGCDIMLFITIWYIMTTRYGILLKVWSGVVSHCWFEGSIRVQSYYES